MAPRSLTIALATIEYPPDPFSAGIGSYTKTLARLLTSRGHKVHVVARASEREGTVDEEGVLVHRLLPGRPRLPNSLGPGAIAGLLLRALPSEFAYRRKVVASLRRLVREAGVDLVEAADHMAETLAYDRRWFPAVPYVVRLHTPLAVTEKVAANIPEVARLGIRRLERRLLRRASHLTAPDARAAQFILDEMEVSRPVISFPNPPSYVHFPTLEAGEGEPNTVLFVGRLNFLKGVDLLVGAIPAIANAHPKTQFIFAGADNVAARGYPNMTSYLRSLLPERLVDSVTFTGHLAHEELRDYYRRATVCVFPSRFESFGYTCLEAMTYGKAIVGSSNGGMAHLLDGGQAGMLFDPPDVDQLGSHIVRLLDDPELRLELGRRARRRALGQFGHERVMDQVEDFYRRAIADLAAPQGPAS